MKEKLAAWLPIGVFLCLLAAISAWNLLRPVRVFSENENRTLAQFPELSAETLLNGDFSEQYEKYLADQFPVRDEWISLKTRTELLLGKKDINGVFFGKNGWLIDKYKGTLSEERIQDNLQKLSSFTHYAVDKLGDDHVRVMLVPTASGVLDNRMPAFASDFDQAGMLAQAEELCPEGTFLNLLPVLQEHKEEPIYYRTDHHWTTLGAYYGYAEWAESCGLTPYAREDFSEETVADDFYGTTHSKINLPVYPDSIIRYTPRNPISYHLTFNLGERESDSLYDESKLEGKDKYSYFLGGNNPMVEITSSSGEPGRRLLIVKDSYSHCFAPFSVNHFEETTLIDLRYFNLGVKQFMEQEDFTDVLILYSTANFADDRNLNTLVK